MTRSDSEHLFDALASQAHVYVFTPDEVLVEAAASLIDLLSDDERQRYHSFRFDEDRRSYLATHAVLHRLLTAYTGVADCWDFVAGEHGKPVIKEGGRGVSFNISHTDGLSAIVLSRDVRCGVDVENCSRKNDFLGVGRKMFSPAEFEHMCEQEEYKRDRFFAYWTLRESFIKATGEGFAGNSDKFWFVLGDPVEIRFDEDRAEARVGWSFDLSHPTDMHAMAVCVEQDVERSIVTREIDTVLK